MKRLLSTAAALAFATGPALAATVTIEFAGDDGNTAVYSFDQETGVSTDAEGNTSTYTFDADTATLCGQTPQGEICATFEDAKQEVGHSTPYTLNIGGGGTATVMAIEESAPHGS